MKKKLLLFIPLAALLIAGCSIKEDADLPQPQQKLDLPDFYISEDEDSSTKATATGSYIWWNTSDKIAVFPGVNVHFPYSFTGTDGARNGTFSPDNPVNESDFYTGFGYRAIDRNYAIYPHTAITSYYFHDFLFYFYGNIPENQTANADGTNNIQNSILVAKTTNVSDKYLYFKHAASYLLLDITGDSKTIRKIVLKGNNGEMIAGRVKVDCSSDSPVMTVESDGASKVTYNCSLTLSSSVSSALLTLAPTTFDDGITIYLYDTSGGMMTWTYNSNVTLNRGDRARASIAYAPEPIDNIAIPDANFKNYLVSHFDTNGDDEISVSEAEAVTSISCSHYSISSMEGIQYFTELVSLECIGNNLTSPLDLSSNVKLQKCRAFYNLYLPSVIFGENDNLDYVDLDSCPISSIDLSGVPNITYLWLSGCTFDNIDLSHNTKLETLYCIHNSNLTSIDVSQLHNLRELYVNNCDLESLNLTKNSKLVSLDCRGNYNLSRIDFGRIESIQGLDCYNCSLSLLDVSRFANLLELDCSDNYLTGLNVSNNPNLRELNCSDNEITGINLTKNVQLKEVSLSYNEIKSLDVSKCPNLEILNVYNNELSYYIDVSNNLSLREMRCGSNPALQYIYLKEGQTIGTLSYDGITTIKYKK